MPEQDQVGSAELGRALRLFQYFEEGQRLKSKPVLTLESYSRVLWLADAPEHTAVRSSHRAPLDDDAILIVDRVPKFAPPAAPTPIEPWLTGPIDNPENEPELRASIPTALLDRGSEARAGHSGGDSADGIAMIDAHPEVTKDFESWLERWETWALTELLDRPVRDFYAALFEVHIAASTNPETYELIDGLGCLSWIEGGDRVRRHVLTRSIRVDFDDKTGRLTVRPDGATESLTLELDMVDPSRIRDPRIVDSIRQDARDVEEALFDRDLAGRLAQRVVHCLDPNGHYLDQDRPQPPTEDAVVAYAPALILRERSQRSLLQIFSTIIAQLQDAESVPEGLMPLVDPDHTPDPGLTWDERDGAVVVADEELYLPLPVNEQQLRIIRSVDAHAHTLVQGPPGTGKTHTAAALISHLLAQGKRILVTAQTDRALKEVREKLPVEIKPLSVAVVGARREDMADLRLAVDRLSQEAAEFDAETSMSVEAALIESVDRLQRERAGTRHRLTSSRRSDIDIHEAPDGIGTLTEIVERHHRDDGTFGWIEGLATWPFDSRPPLTNLEAQELLTYLCDDELRAAEAESLRGLVPLADLLDPNALEELVRNEEAASAINGRNAEHIRDPRFDQLIKLRAETRSRVRALSQSLASEWVALQHRGESWLGAALDDVSNDRLTPWEARESEIARLIGAAGSLIDELDPAIPIVANGDRGELAAIARALLEHVKAAGEIRSDIAGRPKVGFLTNRRVKQAAPFFAGVTVGGRPATTRDQLEGFLRWVEASNLLDALDHAWPSETAIPEEDTLFERLAWHSAELEVLERALALSSGLGDLQLSSSIDVGSTKQPSALSQLHEVARAADERLDLEEKRACVQAALEPIDRVVKQGTPAVTTLLLVDAINARDVDAYRRAVDATASLFRTRAIAKRRDELAARLERGAPELFKAMSSSGQRSDWDDRVAELEAAWQWACVRRWLESLERPDINAMQREISRNDSELRVAVERIAATRAWRHALSEERMTGTARSDLQAYAGLVRRFGKGTGKYAAQRRAEIRDAMARCRPSVPVWILPIYRIAEQIDIAPEIFDVVIVDEASQAGQEAIFLQYLARKVVVVGDDKQVSPAAVGIDLQQIRDLGAQFLYDNRFRANLVDAERSLFDDAKMRYGNPITLVEHRRCVPEIIGFSNSVAYAPDGIRLIPVRQYGADRLTPIEPVFVPDGYTRGGTSRINEPEAEAIVDQLCKCLADPRYDRMTFGVISLLGPTQAKYIEKLLLDRLDPEEWSARDLRCGDSAAFQGSERHVMFLSMVAAPNQHVMPLTRMDALQRFNVAASRAKDQMWVFHSLDPGELSNPEDLRRQLLDYCYRVKRGETTDEGALTIVVSESERDSRFDSLFEQRVFNRIVNRGYAVIPQYEASGYRIDLVVVGPSRKFAVECDGDAFHGLDRYEHDLARQRDLEGSGWQFFRVKEWEFYLDGEEALAPLWPLLEQMTHEEHGSRAQLRPREAGVASAVVDVAPEPAMLSWRLDLETAERAALPLATDGRGAGATDAASDDADDAVESRDQVGVTSPPLAIQSVRHDSPAPLVMALPHAEPTVEANVLPSYREFDGRTRPALESDRETLINELLEIVAIEGPIAGERLLQAHVKASGGHRVGKQIASILNSAVSAAVRKRLLLEDNPLRLQGVKPKTYRLPDQSLVNVRALGPRTLEQVPPQELARVAAEEAAALGTEDEQTVIRATLARYGLKRLTSNTFGIVSRAWEIEKRDLLET